MRRFCATYSNGADEAKWGNRMKDAPNTMQRETDFAIAEERRRWGQTAKARNKGANARSTDNAPSARESTI